MTTARDMFVQSLLEERMHCARCQGSGYLRRWIGRFHRGIYEEVRCSCRDGLNAEGQDRLDEWSRPRLPLEGGDHDDPGPVTMVSAAAAVAPWWRRWFAMGRGER